MQSHTFTSAADALSFAMAGNATLTLRSQKTDAHYTFKVRAPEEGDKKDDVRFVKLLTGPSNTSDYSYVGMIKGGRLVPTAKSRMTPDSKPMLAFNYFLDHARAGSIGPRLEVRHEGSCGRCARPLTVPSSIDRGIGPDCAKLMARGC